MTGIQTIEAARMAIFRDPRLGDISEDLGFKQRTCANCRSFSVYSRNQTRHCQTVGHTVEFGTPSCKAQPKQARRPSFDLALHKLSYYKTEFCRLEERLDRVRRRPLQILAPHRQRFNELDSALQRQKQALDVDQKKEAEYPHWGNLRHRKGSVVYIVDCFQYTKIGYTSIAAWWRMKGLLTGNPFPITLIAVCPGTLKTEKELQAPFKQAGLHHRGDWFRLNEAQKAELLAMVKRQNGQILDPPIEFK